ncbi:protein NATD1-like isoform X2 [Mustelus asterias]
MAMSRKVVANLLTVMLPEMSSSYPATSSAHTPSQQTVQHDRGRHRFSIKLGDSRDEAVLRYKYIGNKMIDVYSTSVPHKFRGHGIGVQLAQMWRSLGP